MALYRKYNYFIFATIVANCLSIIVLSISLGTPLWYTAKLSPGVGNASVQISAKVNYGLFTGTKTEIVTNPDTGRERPSSKDLKIVCNAGLKICMYSCGQDGDSREVDLQNYWSGIGSDEGICAGAGSTNGESQGRAHMAINAEDKNLFLDYGMWISTVIFMCAAAGFAAVSGVQAMYNTYRAPVQPIFSIFGLYIWNGLSATCALISLILWGSAFSSTLKENSVTSNSISGIYSVESSSLGYSYWIVIISELLCFASIGVLRYRTYKIQQIENKLKVVKTEATSPDALVY